MSTGTSLRQFQTVQEVIQALTVGTKYWRVYGVSIGPERGVNGMKLSGNGEEIGVTYIAHYDGKLAAIEIDYFADMQNMPWKGVFTSLAKAQKFAKATGKKSFKMELDEVDRLSAEIANGAQA